MVKYRTKIKQDRYIAKTWVLDTEQLLQNFRKKGWKLCSVKAICKRADERGTTAKRKPSSGRPKTARTAENVRYLKLLISENRTLTLMLRHLTKY